MSFDVDAFLNEREGYESTVRIVTKGRLLDEIKQLESQLAAAKRLDETENRLPEAPKIQERIAELRAEVERTAKEFRFKEVPRHVYEALIAEFPPSRAEREASDEPIPWSPDKFPPALIAAASVDPKLDRESAKKLWRGLPFGEARRLFVAALQPQGKVGAVPLAVSGTGATPTTGTNSGTADPEGSPEASS